MKGVFSNLLYGIISYYSSFWGAGCVRNFNKKINKKPKTTVPNMQLLGVPLSVGLAAGVTKGI
jgi:hypothetical protein